MKTKAKSQNEIPQKAITCLASHFGYCLYKSAMRMRSLIDIELKPHGLVSSQLGILRMLDTMGPLSQIDLGEEMVIDKASMVKLLDGLENKKFIKRVADTKDRRIKFVNITKAGSKKLEQLSEVRLSVEDKFFIHLTAAEKASLKEIIPKLLKD